MCLCDLCVCVFACLRVCVCLCLCLGVFGCFCVCVFVWVFVFVFVCVCLSVWCFCDFFRVLFDLFLVYIYNCYSFLVFYFLFFCGVVVVFHILSSVLPMSLDPPPPLPPLSDSGSYPASLAYLLCWPVGGNSAVDLLFPMWRWRGRGGLG